ncbi:hypothetical protein [Chitinophaga japonensis]|uniref:Uncharacterized protein n=1 Tax=Chitinophaga japonensis TaxID=104662 RepID=A0A562TEX7_CHIJA|nr:hypothetical protein [Chitinophaga japonensis]TWI91540.1 hypothetical protein LX66_0911 [Chitinophaga japonensis]
MKRFIILAMLVTGSIAFSAANAQVRVNLNVNIGSQPVWGPVGYDHAEYYYLPDIDAYYYIPGRQFIYLSGSRWIRASALPARYRSYDLYRGYKVVINEPEPWRHADVYRVKYAGYKGRHDQVVIRDSRDSRYYVIKDHPQHKHWKKEQRKGKGRNRR